jgi:hypothetical protein
MPSWIWVDNFSRKIDKDLLVMEVIQWLNDTFVPLGMRPVEDLETGLISNAYSCTLANTICSNLGDPYEDIPVPNRRRMEPIVSVSTDETIIAFSPANEYDGEPIEYMDGTITIQNPKFVEEFVRAFDAGEYQEFVKEPEFKPVPICKCTACKEHGKGDTNV